MPRRSPNIRTEVQAEARLQCRLQARIVPKQHAKLEIYHMDSHRLAFYLDADGQLVPLIQRALKRVTVSYQALGLYSAVSDGSRCRSSSMR